MASRRRSYYGRSDELKYHSYNVQCDRCGFKVKREHVKMEWTGLLVCDATINNCWEPRNAQDFVRGVPDRQSVVPVRPDPDPNFGCFSPATFGLAVAGCTTVGVFYWNG